MVTHILAPHGRFSLCGVMWLEGRPHNAKAFVEPAEATCRSCTRGIGALLRPRHLTTMPDPKVDEPILQFFVYDHLPPFLQTISKPFADLARGMVSGGTGEFPDALPRNPERTVALRKLLEAKDAAVRALVYKP